MKEVDTFIKIVVVGDQGVGKTWFLSTFVHHKLPEKCGPTLFENHTTQFTFDEVEYELSVWDTPGSLERKKLRCLSYQDADVFLVCYALDNRASFENVRYRWLPELRRKAPGIPRILLGLKADMKTRVPNPVSMREGEFMQFDIQAPAFFEYSITTPKKLEFIFAEAVRIAVQKKVNYRKQSCVIQ